ncbi:heme ABC transporter permease [Amorphus orientalis]|uniref:Heme exporter protein C n=1 Tax=Amorphus orientalis TaxID=649198 RepID=A0AAE3VR64_9HYPH|nr:heme ABC transporter permease [Amorphus orientalis]MDQ0317229.1 heme exporter protein C [Amorphus orientalis]
MANVSAPSQSTLQSLANPTRFVSLADRLLPWLAALTVALMAAGLYLGFFVAPADYQQGETVRIMFVHVPAAWVGMFVYVVMASAALGSLVWKHPLADVTARAAAPVGAVFTLICLVTGSLWGRPMWGAWWVWDARLTSMLVLLLMYLGLIALWHTIEDPIRAGRVAAILILVGVINIPIIKFSVDWWYTLHQPASVFRFDGPTIHISMLIPLLLMGAAFMSLVAVMILMSMKNEILRRRIRAISIRAAYEGRKERA